MAGFCTRQNNLKVIPNALINNIFKRTYTLGENAVFQKCFDLAVQPQSKPKKKE